MTCKRVLVLGAVIAVAIAYAAPAQAVVINFTVDTIGSADPSLTPIAPSAANIGKYNAGSFVALSGSVSGSLSGLGFSGTFSAQKAASGAWSTGNPGSLVSYYGGTLLADVDPAKTAISFPGGSTLDAGVYTGTYPVKGGPAVPLTPQPGGGIIGTPGSAPADYGVSLKITAVIFTAASGTAAMRDAILDVVQHLGVPNQALGAPVAGVQTFTVKNNIDPKIASSNFDYNLKGAVVLGNTVPDLVGTSPISNVQGTETGAQLGSLKTVVVDSVRQIYQFYLTVPTTSTTTQSITGDTPVTITVTTTGQMAASALVQLPEPATLALAGFAAVPLGLMAWRRRKRA